MTALKILFVPLLEKGHVHPLIGVMQHLQRMGHALACYGIERAPIAAQLADAGIACAWFPVEGRAGSAASPERRTVHLQDPRWLLRWCALGIARSLDRRNVDALRDAIRRLAPDVVCCDPMAYHGCAAAQAEGLPWAAISPLMVAAARPDWRCPWSDAMTQLQPMILEHLHALGATGLRLHVSDVVSPWLNTVFVSETFAPRSWSGNRHSFYLGPSRPLGARGDEPAFPWPRLKDDVPLVYVSGGGGQALSFEPRTFVEICRSLSQEQAQFVCALQGLWDTSLPDELPGSCVAVRYAPQVGLLERRARVAVIHGGINSVTECLTWGRPMLVCPIGHDQFLQARAVVERGLGLSIDAAALSREACREALLRLLEPSAELARALEQVRLSYTHNGAADAAELIIRLARTRRAPALPLGD